MYAIRSYYGIILAKLLADQVLVEAAQGGEQAGGGAGLIALLQPPGEIPLQLQAVQGQQGVALAVQPGSELLQIRAIRRQGIGRQATLEPQGIQKLIDQGLGHITSKLASLYTTGGRLPLPVITSYSIHYTKLYDLAAVPFQLDGNAVTADGSGYPGDDWDKVNVLGGDSALAKTGLIIDDPEPIQAQFTGGGSKDQQDIPNWKS